jgi:enolase-phosphatase E1
MNPGVILLDIEGTVTPLDFVHRTLFPFARSRMRDYLAQHAGDAAVQAALQSLADENRDDLESGEKPPEIAPRQGAVDLELAACYLEWLMERDRKSTSLKELQGRIWEEGYRRGLLVSEVFPDVRPAFERWRSTGQRIAIFSSGSILAQKNLFRATVVGDLSCFIEAYFDTTTGPKKDSASYGRIAAGLRSNPAQICFVSDVAAELDAARWAGMSTVLSKRSGNAPDPNIGAHPVMESFDEIA